jgi:hypothetical protein
LAPGRLAIDTIDHPTQAGRIQARRLTRNNRGNRPVALAGRHLYAGLRLCMDIGYCRRIQARRLTRDMWTSFASSLTGRRV